MKTSTRNPGLKVKASVKAGGFNIGPNHNRSGLKVRTAVKSGYTAVTNHSRRITALGQ